ncbi:hypothetical protein C2S52_021218 [Perilla frutescens var. hirtella]|nr:hypothetical protein C2S52_021218 [Perilla frutescens var. hirtella]
MTTREMRVETVETDQQSVHSEVTDIRNTVGSDGSVTSNVPCNRTYQPHCSRPVGHPMGIQPRRLTPRHRHRPPWPPPTRLPSYSSGCSPCCSPVGAPGKIEWELLFVVGERVDKQSRSSLFPSAGQFPNWPSNFSKPTGVTGGTLLPSGVPSRPTSSPQPTPMVLSMQQWGPLQVCAKASLSVLLAAAEEGSEACELDYDELDPTKQDMVTKPPLLETELQHLWLYNRFDVEGIRQAVYNEAFRFDFKISITLGNGQCKRAEGLCRKVPLYVHSHTFEVDCFVFSLGGVDVMLGVSWLEALGDVKAGFGARSSLQIGGVRFAIGVSIYTLIHGQLFHKGRVEVTRSLVWTSKLITEFRSRSFILLLQGLMQGMRQVKMLMKWVGFNEEEATWLDVDEVQKQFDVDEVQKQFPDFSLVVKTVSRRAALDRPDLQVYARG